MSKAFAISAAEEAALWPTTRAALKDARDSAAAEEAALRKGDEITMLRAQGFALATKAVFENALKAEKRRRADGTEKGAGVDYFGSHSLQKSAPMRNPTAALQQRTRHAMARATVAIEEIKVAERNGDRGELQRAKADGLLAKSDLEAASANEKALAAMRSALAKPLRLF